MSIVNIVNHVKVSFVFTYGFLYTISTLSNQLICKEMILTTTRDFQFISFSIGTKIQSFFLFP